MSSYKIDSNLSQMQLKMLLMLIAKQIFNKQI